MGKWTNTKITDNVTMKVIDVERGMLDTNPDLYVERGEAFFNKGNNSEAEKEYLRAVKYSNKDSKYIEKLIRFYYATCNKGYKEKADKLFWKWFLKEKEFNVYLVKCIIFFSIAKLGLSGMLLSPSILFVIPFCGMIYFSNPKVQFIYSARKKNFVYFWKCLFSGLIAVILITIFMLSAYESGTIFGINLLNEYVIFNYMSAVIGVIFGVIGLVYFNKMISYLKSKVKSKFLHKFFSLVRMVGNIIFVMLGMSILWCGYEELEELRETEEYNKTYNYFKISEEDIDKPDNKIDYYESVEVSEMISVPNIVGMTPEQAKIVLEESGLNIGEKSEYYSKNYDTGEIMSQTPDAGAQVPVGGYVDIMVVLESKNPKYEENTIDYEHKEVTGISEVKTGLYCYEGEYGQYRIVIKEVSEDRVVFMAGYIGWNECFSKEIIGRRDGNVVTFEYSVGYNEVDGDGELNLYDGYIFAKFNNLGGGSRNFLTTNQPIRLEWVNDSKDIYVDENILYVASVIGCDESDLHTYDSKASLEAIKGSYLEEYVSSYLHVDEYGSASDYLLLLYEDGMIIRYYPNDTYEIIKN